MQEQITKMQDHIKVLNAQHQSLKETVQQTLDGCVLLRSQNIMLTNDLDISKSQVRALQAAILEVNEKNKTITNENKALNDEINTLLNTQVDAALAQANELKNENVDTHPGVPCSDSEADAA